jgi:hypothetical protein
VHFGDACLCCYPQSSTLQLSSPRWETCHSHSLIEGGGFSSCQAQWVVLGLGYLSRQAFCCHSLSSTLQVSSPQWGIWHFSLQCRSWSDTVGSAGHFCALGKLVSLYPQNGILSLSGGAGFPLFDRAAGALPWDVLVVSTGPPCSVGMEATWPSRRANSRAWD